MLLDLTTVIAPDHPALIWARQQDNAHIALGHVGTHLDVYECRHIPLEAFRCPGVLIEVGFLSNLQEERNLNSASYIEKLARGIADGVIKYHHSLAQ